MSLFDKAVEVLESRAIKALATVIGLMIGLLKLSDSAQFKPIQPIATIFLLLAVLYFFLIIPREFARRVRVQEISDAERSYRYTSERYGMGYSSLQVECIIKSDGSAQVRRRVKVEAHSRINKLDTFLLIPESPPLGEKWDINFTKIESLTSDRSVSLSQKPEQDGKQSAIIAIAPQLDPGQRVEYLMIEELPPKLYAVSLTEEELKERKTRNDYFGWTINRPTGHLSLRIYFPDIKPEFFDHEVRYASAAPGIPAESFQLEEQERLMGPSLQGPEGGRYTLKFDVDHPMIGLVYILLWRPLKSD
jgi:hypothetical protein